MPHLTATIVSLSQDMDLESGSMANFMMLRLEDGTAVRALIGEEAAQEIVRLSVAQNGSTSPFPSMDTEEGSGDPEPATYVFKSEEPDGPPEEHASPSKPPRAPPRRRAKSVSRDEAGYPVVSMEGGTDPRDAVGGRDRDEDGVGQV